MSFRKLLPVGLIAALLLLGVWLMAGTFGLQPETAVRQQALTNGLSPAGIPRTASDAGIPWAEVIHHQAVAPASVILSDIPPAEYNPKTDPYARYLRGEVDLDENEGIVSRAEMARRRAAARNLAAAPIGPLPTGPGPILGTNFDSIDVIDCCGGGTVVPPDPEMSAGPNHLIAVVNLALEIYDKSGTSLVGPVTFDSFFSALGGTNCTAGGPFDPNTLYDEMEDRFIIAADGNGNAYCVAVSQTSDPTGAYWLYEFPTNVGGNFFDYPHAGVGQDAIYMGANMFAASYVEARVWAFDKTAMYSGGAASAVSISTGDDDTPQPVNLHGANDGTWPTTGPHYIFTSRNFNGATYELYSWDDPFGTNTFTDLATFDLPAVHGVAVGLPVGSVQQGGATITANDFRPLDFEYRNGSGWSAMTVSCNPGGGTVNCVQWAEVDLAGASLVQTGIYGTNGDYRYFPDVAANRCGDGAVGYTRSNSSSFPGVWVAGPLVGAAGVQTPNEIVVKDGETTYAAFADRWGDYTGMTIDPNGVDFWYLGEYSKIVNNPSANWANYIGSFTLPNCQGQPDFGLSATPDPAQICAPADAVYTVDVSSSQGFSDLVTLSVNGEPAGTTTSFSVNPVSPPGASVLTIGNTGAAAAGSYSLDIVGMAPTSTHTTTVGLELYAAAPAAPTLTDPPDGATGVSTVPTFMWTAVSQASSYDIEIATDAGFTNIVDSATVPGTSYTPASSLPAGVTLYWRVRASNTCGAGSYSATFSFTTVNCATPNLAIPDNTPAGVTDEVLLTDSGNISDLDVSILAQHTWVGDLVFELEHVDTGTSVTFYDRPGVPASTFGCSGNDVDATLDDEAATPVENECGAGTPTIDGTFIPNNALSAFDGESIAGTWRITASDNAGGDTGTLLEWCVLATGGGGGGGDPDIDVSPISLSSTQPPDVMVGKQMTITNVGTADLVWNIEEDDALRLPLGDATLPDAANATAVTKGDAGLSAAGTGQGITVTPVRGNAPDGSTTITHSQDQSIVQFNSVSCNAGGLHTDNHYIRHFTLTDFGITGAFDVTEVEIGIEQAVGAGGTQPVEMRLYTWDPATPFIFANLNPIGSAAVQVPDQSLTIYTIPVMGTAPAGSTLVVDFFTPNGQTAGNSLFVGSNPNGQTAPSYLAAADCGITEPTDTAVIGFPDMHIVMNVTGNEGGGGPVACSTPVDIPWASVSPTAGTTISNTSDVVDVTFDSTGLSTGVYTGTLCVNSNDPDESLVTVPLTLDVQGTAMASIVMTKTVGTTPGVCATTDTITVPQGTDVYYCYAVENTGAITLSLHDLVDDKLGTLLSGFAFDLVPGASVDTVAAGLTVSDTIDLPTINTAVWTAYTASGPSASYTDTATVNVDEAAIASITLTKTVSSDGSCGATNAISVPWNTQVTYCYTVENTGNVTLTTHTLSDTVGTTTTLILDGFAYDLVPGATVAVTDTVLLGPPDPPFPGTVTNCAVWEARDPVDRVAFSTVECATVTLETPTDVSLTGFDGGIGAMNVFVWLLGLPALLAGAALLLRRRLQL